MAEALVATGKHTVTALTRPDSTSEIPNGVKSVTVDYADKESLVAALRGQDALIITLSITAPPETHPALVEAAGPAGEALDSLLRPLVALGRRLEAVLADAPDWMDGAARARIEGAIASLG